MKQAESAHAYFEVVREPAGTFLRIRIEDDTPDAIVHVCSVDLQPADLGDALAGGKYASIRLWRDE